MPAHPGGLGESDPAGVTPTREIGLVGSPSVVVLFTVNLSALKSLRIIKVPIQRDRWEKNLQSHCA